MQFKIKPEQFFQMAGRSLVLVENPKLNKFLTIKETRNRGWFIPAGKVEPPENFISTAIRECKEEAGLDIELKGILKIIYDQRQMIKEMNNFLLMKFIFLAQPINPDQQLKDYADIHSEGAKWVSIQEFIDLGKKPPYIRGNDLVVYAKYLQNGGPIFPINLYSQESVVTNNKDYYGFK